MANRTTYTQGRANLASLCDRVAETREPFEGVGKPEPLRFHLQGCWSRRVSQEHRLVYLVRDDRVDFVQARYHY